MNLQKSKQIAQLETHPAFITWLQDQKQIFEALRNELETPQVNTPFIQGQVTTYRNIFNSLDEHFKNAKTQS